MSVQIDLSDKRALVTGGGVGIGRGVVLALARAGAGVALTYHSHDGAAVAAEVEALGRRAVARRMDAVDSGSVRAAVDEAARALGGLDIVVNNAGGLIGRRTVREMSDEHWHQVLDVNLSSAFYAVRAALPHMTGGGSIVNISSQAGRNGGGDGAPRTPRRRRAWTAGRARSPKSSGRPGSPSTRSRPG